MGLPAITIEGRLGADPELRFVPSGAAVANLRVASGSRKKNQQTNQWEDDKTCWLDVVCWRELAENAAESLHSGDAVVITGFLYQESYTTREGENRTVYKVDARSIAPALNNATAQVRRTQRQGGQQQGGQQQQQQGAPTWGNGWGAQGQQQGQPQQQDPWATQQPAPNQSQQGWGNQPSYGEPPF